MPVQQTSIAQVGVGFLYHPGNIRECGPAIALLAERIRKQCPDQLHRFNIQFRPWRPPAGRPSISERILSHRDIEEASAILLEIVERDSFLEQFVQENTNVAVNLLCGGAREALAPFSECYFGLAKIVIRADGTLYPCFRVSAQEDPLFYSGSILQDPPLKIALRELYVAAHSVKQECIPEHEKCLFCVFNNMLQDGIVDRDRLYLEPTEDYFF